MERLEFMSTKRQENNRDVFQAIEREAKKISWYYLIENLLELIPLEAKADLILGLYFRDPGRCKILRLCARKKSVSFAKPLLKNKPLANLSATA